MKILKITVAALLVLGVAALTGVGRPETAGDGHGADDHGGQPQQAVEQGPQRVAGDGGAVARAPRPPRATAHRPRSPRDPNAGTTNLTSAGEALSHEAEELERKFAKRLNDAARKIESIAVAIDETGAAPAN